MARRRARDESATRARFVAGDVFSPGLRLDRFDVVYARSVLSHLATPEAAVAQMAKLIGAEGCVVLDDIDIGTVWTDPPSAAYDRINQLFVGLVTSYGAQPDTGSRLEGMLSAAGLSDVRTVVEQPILCEGLGKRYWELTFAETVPAMLDAGVVSRQEAEDLLRAIRPFAEDPAVSVALPRRIVATGVAGS